jgi:hypothetical protein
MDIDAHKKASHECMWMFIGSFIPIILDSILRCWILKESFFIAMSNNLESGEVFLFTSALITPFFFFLVLKMKEKNKDDPVLKYFTLIFLASLVAFFGGLISFSYYRIGRVLSENYQEVGELMTFTDNRPAIAIYILSLLVWYYASYHNHRSSVDYTQTRNDQIDKLRAKSEASKGQNNG